MQSTAERFWDKVNFLASGGCWEYGGYVTPMGYGRLGANTDARKSPVFAHRWSYEYLVGPIPEGLSLDHLCENKVCVNPAHLEPVTRAENVRRHFIGLTTCKNGHEYTPENTYIGPSKGERSCKKCRSSANRKYRSKHV